MYLIAFQTIRRNYPIFLALALVMTIAELLLGELPSGGLVFAYGLLAMYSHRMVLLDETLGWMGKPGDPKPPIWGFGWRYLVFFLAFMALFAGFVFILGDTDGEIGLGVLLLAIGLATPLHGIVLALWGTVLPASAIGEDGSFGAAFRRGRSRFWRTLLRLACGPFVFALLAIAMTVYVAATTDVMSGMPAVLFGFAVTLIGLVPTHLAAVALSLAYREAETV